MKKIVLLLFGTLMFMPSYGQDTITESDTCYMFWPHNSPLFLFDTVQREISSMRSRFFERVEVSPGTLVYGVSLRGDMPLDSSVNVSLVFRDNKQNSEYTFHDTAWLDSSVTYRYLSFDARIQNSGNPLFTYGENCNEIYFHRPWAVPDTFYVYVRYWIGTQDVSLNFSDRYKKLDLAQNSVEWPRAYYFTDGEEIPANDDFFPRPYDTTQSLGGNPDYPRWASEWGREFPIMEPNRTRCGKPVGVRLAERGDGWVTVCWNGGSGDSYRVTVEGPDDTVVMETADTAIRLDSLMPDANYWVQVQSLCRYQYYSFDSSFVNPGHTRMGFRTFSAGMTEPGDSPQITMHPNPASHAVEIVSSLPMTHIEVADVLGRVVGTYPQSNQNSFTLDVSPLSTGTYLLRITTPAGSTTKKLLVQ